MCAERGEWAGPSDTVGFALSVADAQDGLCSCVLLSFPYINTSVFPCITEYRQEVSRRTEKEVAIQAQLRYIHKPHDTHPHACTPACVHTHAYTCRPMPRLLHVCTHTHVHSPVCMHAHTPVPMYLYIHMEIFTYTHRCTLTCIGSCVPCAHLACLLRGAPVLDSVCLPGLVS